MTGKNLKLYNLRKLLILGYSFFSPLAKNKLHIHNEVFLYP